MAYSNSNPLIEHYHKTSDLTQTLWEQRNQTFLLLILALGAASLLSFDPKFTNDLLTVVAPRALGIVDTKHLADIKAGFPYAVVHAALLVLVFYFMANLYHRTVGVMRSYDYLGALEKEIRTSLQLADGSIAFSREGNYYWNHRPPLMRLVKYMYIVIIGVLLVSFFGFRFLSDWRAFADTAIFDLWRDRRDTVLLFGADLLICLVTLKIFVGYWRESMRLDRRPKLSAPSGFGSQF